MRFIFTKSEHEEHGTEGWCPNWMRNADPLPGMGVAHDILEHPRNDGGDIESELRAFGAALYIRHEGCYWASKGQVFTDWADNVAYEIYRDMLYAGTLGDKQGEWLSMPAARSIRLPEDYLEWQLDECVTKVRKFIEDEGGEDAKVLRRYFRVPYVKAMKAHIRAGYRSARSRFPKRDAYELAHDFREIEERADKLLAFACMGEELIVDYVFSRGLINMTTRYPEFD